MKSLNINAYKPWVFILGTGLLIAGCSKELDFGDSPSPLTPASLDANAGTWDPIVLTSIDQVAVPVPAVVNSVSYMAELESIKKLQANLTDEQKEIIEYWSSGGIIRWNQIMLDIAAEFDLPPAPREDGTYPGPDSENPFADPMFPFSNPPYASRAYSYIHVAQFDALKAAWHYKFMYNRPSPCKVDNSIKVLMPVTDLPSYPSEEAVMSAVTVDIMKVMFPAAVEEITRLAADQRNAALWSGKATASDLSSGMALGKAIAAIILNRAGTDGMSASAGNPAIWQAMADSAAARGETPWISLEDPRRPPMLPLFGKVLGWNMTTADFINERPGPPPSTSSEQMKIELEEVKNTVENLTREQLAICHFWADGAGTPTPPGHWNYIATRYIREAKFSEVRTARVYALLNMAMLDAAIACWDVKFTYFNPRPSQLDPSIKTVTGLPNFPSFTSGHSTFSAASATVLSYIFPGQTQHFFGLADEAAISRLYGGIHYRSDIEVGIEHGKVVGQYTVNYALTDGAD